MFILQDTPGVDLSGLITSLQGTFLEKSPLLLDAGMDNNVSSMWTCFQIFENIYSKVVALDV